MNKVSLSLIVLALFASLTVRAADAPATQPVNDAEARYTATLEKRVSDILDVLKLTDDAKKTKVHDILIAQYRALRGWQTENESKVKKKGITQEEKQAIIATRQPLHDKFVAALSAELTPEQVEVVKDKMTYGKVQFTYNGYMSEYPNLTDEQKAKVLDFLKQARELAIDGGSSEEKSDIFNKYKGKINNYLAAQGVSSKNKKPKPATQPAAQ
jgi:Spy/CpxP family protein refolding chaperone